MKRKYVDFDPAKGFPAGKTLQYECGLCHELVPSFPSVSSACACGNLRIDVDGGRLSAKDEKGLRLVRVRQKSKGPKAD